jgi:DNA-binding response OmpR family regulator
MTDKVGERLVQMTRVNECIRKPFTSDELVAVVKRHVGRRESDVPDTGESDDTWIVIANVQEMLSNAVAEAIAQRVDDLVDADTRTRILSIIAEMLEEVFDERFAANVVEVSRDRPANE